VVRLLGKEFRGTIQMQLGCLKVAALGFRLPDSRVQVSKQPLLIATKNQSLGDL
jgi:hypothetical protein